MIGDAKLIAVLRNISIGFVATLGIAIPFILFWDEPLAWHFEMELDRDIHQFMGMVTETANSAIWFGLAVTGFAASRYLASHATSSENAQRFINHARSWGFMIVSMITAAALLNILKLVIGRYRPRYMFNEGLVGFEPFGVALKMASFPSGHAQSICSAMIALMFLTPRYTPIYLFVALAVSASRFLTAVHFVSDVIVGAFVSFAVAVLIRYWFERDGQRVSLSSN